MLSLPKAIIIATPIACLIIAAAVTPASAEPPPRAGIVEPVSTEPSYRTTAPAEPSYQTTAPAEPSHQTTAPAEPSHQTTAPAEPSHQTTAPAEPSYQTTAPAEPSYQTTAPAEQDNDTSGVEAPGPGPATYQVTCTTGNFVGKALISLTRTPTHASTTVIEYSIQRLNGQAGGNKANITVRTDYNGASGGYGGAESVRSPDSMIQDGNVHQLGLSSVVIENDYRKLKATSGSVTFTFDKSGVDPYCSTPASLFD